MKTPETAKPDKTAHQPRPVPPRPVPPQPRRRSRAPLTVMMAVAGLIIAGALAYGVADMMAHHARHSRTAP